MAEKFFEKPDKATADANRKGCLILLLKFFLFLISAFLIEFILDKTTGVFQEKNAVIDALKPYQNSYYSFNPYFITIEDLDNEYSFLPGAAWRFIFSVFFGYIIYGIFSVIISYIKALKNYENRITKILFYFMLSVCFYVAFYLPKKKTTFDLENKAMIITSREMFLFPQSTTIPFKNVPEIRYEFGDDYDRQSRSKHIFLKYYIELAGKKINLGDREVDSFELKSGEKREWSPSEGVTKEAKTTMELLNRLVKTGK